MDNVLKGIFNTNVTKNTEQSDIVSKVKKIRKLPEARQTHILSKDTQDINNLLNELTNILKAHSIESYSEMST
jgi:hypothetical protein